MLVSYFSFVLLVAYWFEFVCLFVFYFYRCAVSLLSLFLFLILHYLIPLYLPGYGIHGHLLLYQHGG